MGVEIRTYGNFGKTEKFLKFLTRGTLYDQLEPYAQRGVEALRSATPVDSGLTAASWSYQIEKGPKGAKIDWLNTNVNSGFPVAISLQYGHGTGTGGFVAGRDYINPAIRPIFDDIANDVWKAVTSA